MKLVVSLLGFSAALLLSSCSLGTYHEASDRIKLQQENISDIQHAISQQEPDVVVKPGYYVNSNPVQLQNYPNFLNKTVSLQAQHMPLNLMMNRLLQGGQMVVTYNSSVSPDIKLDLDYTGTLRGALKNIAEQTGYAYTISGNHINWASFETRTFNISFMPGNTAYSLGGNNSSKLSSTSNSTNAIQDDQYSNLTGSLSIWTDLRNTLNRLKSKDGTVVVSESTTTVTAHDHPQNIDAMARYIKKLNTILSQEVQIKVQVLELDLNKQYQYGINWSLVDQKIGSLPFSVSGNAGKEISLASSTSLNQAGGSALTSLTLGNAKSSNAMIEALSEQGRLSVSTQPTLVTLNNQIATVRIVQSTGYLKSTQTTVNDGTSTTTLTPGSVTDGFTLYLLPKIQDNEIYLQISSTLANLVSLSKASAGSINGTTNSSTIEVPTLAQKSFNQRSRVPNGSTLVVAGYRNLRNQTLEASPMGITPLGGQAAQRKNVETIVLITPTIIKSRD